MMATQGIPALQSLSWYCITIIVGIAAHIVFLLFIVQVLGKMSPLKFLSGMREAWLIAFSTTSSAATLPVTIRNVEENLGVDKKVSNFALPVGATCNMDGTALYEGVAVIFMIQVFGGTSRCSHYFDSCKNHCDIYHGRTCQCWCCSGSICRLNHHGDCRKGRRVTSLLHSYIICC